jgi:DNA invertase Pin-like site-specific DNA recombinase
MRQRELKENVIYLRKSRADVDAEARGEGETLARHEGVLLDLAKRQGLIISKIFREIVSGESISARPMMQQLLTEVEQGKWGGVLVMEVERLARGDTSDQGMVAKAFKYSGTLIITPSKTYDPSNEFDEEYFEFGLFMSRREYKTINRRLTMGLIAAIKEGKFIGRDAPYGYSRVHMVGGGITLEIYPAEAEAVKLIFDWYVNGDAQPDGISKKMGPSLIAHKLDALGFKPRISKTWTTSSILDMLQNPAYCGKVRWNSRKTKKSMFNGKVQKSRPRTKTDEYIEAPGLHQGIISEELYLKAQQVVKKNTPMPTTYTLKNPLSSIIRCSECGRAMIRRPMPGQPPALKCPQAGCGNVSTQLHIVEKKLLLALEQWLHEYKVSWGTEMELDTLTLQVEAKKKAVKKLSDGVNTLQTQLDGLYDLLEQGLYTKEIFLERSQKLTERIKQGKREYEEAAKEIAQFEKREAAKQTIVPKIEHVLAVYESTTDIKKKNELLKEVIERVDYHKDKGKGGRWGDPEDFTLYITPNIPL